MGVSGIGRIQFENVFKLAKDVSARGSKETKEISTSDTTQNTGKSQSVKDYAAELGAKYGVNITVYSGSEKEFDSLIMGAGGTNNLMLSKNIAEKMMKDPALAQVVEEKISKIPEDGLQVKEAIEKNGHKLLACGMQINSDGRISYWSVSYDPHAAEKNRDAAQKKLDEKRAEKKKEEEKRMEILLAKGDTPDELVAGINNDKEGSVISINPDLIEAGSRINMSV